MLFAFGLLVASVIVHELAHAVAAWRLGDSTARSAGGTNLNPLRLFDPLGSIVVPALSVVFGWGYLGWAKAAPLDHSRLRGGRKSALLVVLAGPLANTVLVGVAWLGFTLSFTPGFGPLGIGPRVFFYLGLTNLWLLLLNLLPVPPLDGSAILERLLPSSAWPRYLRIRPYLFRVLLGVAAASVLLNLGLFEHLGNWLANLWWRLLTG